VLRNSGTTDALIRRHLGRLVLVLTRRSTHRFTKASVEDDPLFRLQYLARIAIQYDLADLTAMIATPSLVSLFVWRDGWFALEGSSLLIVPCELPYLWMRFGFLLLIKPAAAVLARTLLKRAMRKTLLGKRTVHGVSQLAARLIAERQLVTSGSAAGGLGSDAQLHKELGLSAEELAAVRDELSLAGLNFRVLWRRLLKRSTFFAAVAVLQAFAAFPVRTMAPPPAISASSAETIPLPRSSAWVYVPWERALELDKDVRTALADANATCAGHTNLTGWAAPSWDSL
jgi:hypothetical protein